jgi:diguanylate cyclase (GGDEF)-like protein
MPEPGELSTTFGAHGADTAAQLKAMPRDDLEALAFAKIQEVAELAHRLEENRIESAHDWTGLLNKQHFQTAGTVLLNQTTASRSSSDYGADHDERRSGNSGGEARTAVIMMDGSSIKKANDTLGHVFVDKMIIYMGTKISGNFRDTDVVGHFGGDEFAVVAQNITPEAIERKINGLNGNMEFRDGDIVASPRLDAGWYFPEPGESLQDAVIKADHDLNARKQQRKDMGGPATSWIEAPKPAAPGGQAPSP